ncbi:MAG: hypothetical protein Q7J48_19865 [Nocardioides sp.]|nr:hypothetical protein [Nocardioides sp.]
MQGWQSGTAISYAEFASLFGPVTANLSMCAGVLRGAYEAEHAIWREARASVDELPTRPSPRWRSASTRVPMTSPSP